jgi:hypothetical protein
MSTSSLRISLEPLRNRRWPQVLRKITPRTRIIPTDQLMLLISTRSLKISLEPRSVPLLDHILPVEYIPVLQVLDHILPVEYIPVLQVLEHTPLLAQERIPVLQVREHSPVLQVLGRTRVLQPTALNHTVSKLTHHRHRAGRIISRQEIPIRIEKNSIHVSRPSMFLCCAI